MYYEENPSSQHDLKEISVTLLGQYFRFMTDAGVFSKNMVDYGSQVLLDTLSISEGQSVLDVGCGYGPLGISLAKVRNAKVTMVDINNRALNLAKQNADRNQVEVEIFQSNIYETVIGDFNHVISNPPIRAGKEVVHGIIAGAFTHLKPSGYLTIVIQKKQGAPSAKKKMEEVYGNCHILKKDKGYYILQSEKV